MYVPAQFSESDAARIHKLIADYNFATLISGAGQDLQVSYLPLLFDAQRGERGALLGHMARANPHWRQWSESAPILALFHGPHGYISPNWYQTVPAVPTWNYAVVHVRGTVHLIESSAERKALLQRLVEKHEAGRNPPWRMDLPQDFEAKNLQAIVGFEITIDRLEAKFKLSQNRSAADRCSVIDNLAQSLYESDRQLALLMHELETERTP